MSFTFGKRPWGPAPASSKRLIPDVAPMRWAAVSVVERGDEILSVWNKRYGGWSLPGGRVEDGETNGETQVRELREETGCEAVRAYCVFQGMHQIRPLEGEERAGSVSAVAVYVCEIESEPRGMEEGRPVRWMTREEFLRESPFAAFYSVVFEEVECLRAPSRRQS